VSRRPTLAPRIVIVVAALALGACRTELPSGRNLNVLLISIDTLRADHLGCYGYSRPTSPTMDAFAAESVRFDQAITQAPWTTPSHMTLMTALAPSLHGVNRSFADFAELPSGHSRFRILSPEHVTLAEVLQNHGYETLALTGGATMAAELGFDHGFDEYVVKTHKLSDAVWQQLTTWLDRPHDRPFFLFFHTFEVHAPYITTQFTDKLMTLEQREAMSEAIRNATVSEQETQRRFLEEQGLFRRAVTAALYDGGILAVDRFLGRLFEALRRRDLYDRTLVVLVSDHGEEFGEHDASRIFDAHCTTQYEELIHVPLIVRFPPLAGRGRVVDRPVGLIDVAPTILELVGLPAPETWQGRSFADLFVGRRRGPAWTVSSATCSGPAVRAWRESRYKYIASFEIGADGERSFLPGRRLSDELYDLANDAGERDNLADREPELLEARRSLLYRYFDALAKRERAKRTPFLYPDAELQRELDALGYL